MQLLREVERFLRNSEIPATRFGREVMHDPRFVFDLRKGREPRIRTVTRVRAYLEAAL
jgi:2,4-dienoyl-CoA reductase-like NADH-dependent reductase (Old Yellow Enzyme family)